MINMKVNKLDQVAEKLNQLPKIWRGAATEEFAIYIIGNESRGLQYYPPQKTVTKPKRLYKRTYNYRFGWVVNKFEAGMRTSIKNNVPYAPYVRTRWAGKPWDWKTIPQVISKNISGAMKAVNERIAREIRKSGFGHNTPV